MVHFEWHVEETKRNGKMKCVHCNAKPVLTVKEHPICRWLSVHRTHDNGATKKQEDVKVSLASEIKTYTE